MKLVDFALVCELSEPPGTVWYQPLVIVMVSVCKRSPVTGPEGPKGFQEVKVLRFRDNGLGWW